MRRNLKLRILLMLTAAAVATALCLRHTQNYAQTSRTARKRKLDLLARQAQELNLGY